MKEPGQIAAEAAGDIEFWHNFQRRKYWAAVERAVLEEAAKVAESEVYGFPNDQLTEYGRGFGRACKEIANAIRALGTRQ